MSWGTFVERRPAGDVTASWTVTISWGKYDNGQVLAACDYATSAIYLSFNGGATWTDSIFALSNIRGFASSAQCDRLIVGGQYGEVWLSPDGGATWDDCTGYDVGKIVPGGSYTSVASSRDGRVLFAVTYNRSVYMSSDYGVTWAIVPISEIYGGVVALTPDGTHIIVGGTAGKIDLSTDSGAHWTTVTPAGTSTYWACVATSEDGQVLLAGEHTGYMWISTDGGANWTSRTDHGYHGWTSCSISANGQSMVIGGYDKYFAATKDQWKTWSAYTWPESVSYGYIRTAISPNGEYILAASWDNGRLYTMGVLLLPPRSFPWLGKFQLSHVTT